MFDAARYSRRLRRDHPELVRGNTRLHRLRHPERAKARNALNYAVRVGKIVRPDRCGACGKAPGVDAGGHSGVRGHHPDHRTPLEVVWACVRCHADLHLGEAASRLLPRDLLYALPEREREAVRALEWNVDFRSRQEGHPPIKAADARRPADDDAHGRPLPALPPSVRRDANGREVRRRVPEGDPPPTRRDRGHGHHPQARARRRAEGAAREVCTGIAAARTGCQPLPLLLVASVPPAHAASTQGVLVRGVARATFAIRPHERSVSVRTLRASRPRAVEEEEQELLAGVGSVGLPATRGEP